MCHSGSLTKTTLVTPDEQFGGKGSICGFREDTQITCAAQAQNSVGFGPAVESNISTLTDATKSKNNGKL